jgi:uncharacterized protein (DUF983 family)
MSKDSELALEIVEKLMAVARNSDPQAFKTFLLAGIVTNCLGCMSDRYFAEFIKSDPCETIGCDCHLIAAKQKPMLIAMREHWKSVAKANEGFSA